MYFGLASEMSGRSKTKILQKTALALGYRKNGNTQFQIKKGPLGATSNMFLYKICIVRDC
jgi:hypothetical protein